jgi:hypothetical protein
MDAPIIQSAAGRSRPLDQETCNVAHKSLALTRQRSIDENNAPTSPLMTSNEPQEVVSGAVQHVETAKGRRTPALSELGRHTTARKSRETILGSATTCQLLSATRHQPEHLAEDGD